MGQGVKLAFEHGLVATSRDLSLLHLLTLYLLFIYERDRYK
jgi:hypothetical protein